MKSAWGSRVMGTGSFNLCRGRPFQETRVQGYPEKASKTGSVIPNKKHVFTLFFTETIWLSAIMRQMKTLSAPGQATLGGERREEMGHLDYWRLHYTL